MRRIYALALLSLVLVGTLILLDQLKNDEVFVLSRFLLDVVEKAILVAAIAATASVVLDTRELKAERHGLIKDLGRVRRESDAWRDAARVHVEGLGNAIRKQFQIWKLSDGEADVALLMLKGLSFKEIANMRGSLETTVRQQAVSVYRKSGLSSRTELGAYFLEDLLPGKPDLVLRGLDAPERGEDSN